MAISALPIFNPDIKWAGRAGCLVCGSNVSELGAKEDRQCIDLGVDDEFLGRFGLCFDCALQVARVIDFVSKDSVLGVLEDARALADEAANAEAQAAAIHARIKLDKDTIERLMGAPYPDPPADAVPSPEAA